MVSAIRTQPGVVDCWMWFSVSEEWNGTLVGYSLISHTKTGNKHGHLPKFSWELEHNSYGLGNIEVTKLQMNFSSKWHINET